MLQHLGRRVASIVSTVAVVAGVLSAAAAPAGAEGGITDVALSASRPNPGQAVVVSARIDPTATATLTYKVNFANDVSVTMRDDAASPGGAGDGVFAATIPGQSAGKLVRYRINATAGGVASSEPSATDTMRYRGYVVVNPSVTSQLPVIEWFMDDAVYDDILANHRLDDFQGDAVWAFNGQVWDGVKMSVRGNSSRVDPKVNWKVEFPKGYATDFGGSLPYPLDKFALQNYKDNFADIGWATVAAAGARATNIVPVRTQRNGAFWSLGRVMDTEGGAWRKAQGVKNWAIYKGDGGSVGKSSSPAALQASLWLDKKTREDEDFTDVWTLSNTVDAPASSSQLAWIYRNVNVPELINYMAINSIIRHQDSGWYNWWLARDTEGTGRWEMWHWDLNWIFTTPSQDGKGLFLTPDTSNRFTRAMLNYPEFKAMFYRRLRTLADQFLAPGRYEAQWDAITARTNADWNLDRSKWGGYSPSSARSQFISGLTDRRNAVNNNTPALVPTSQAAAPNITISNLQTNPSAAGGQFIQLTNPNSTAVDVSGWTIPAAGLTIQAGTVIPANGTVLFVANDRAYQAANPTGNRFIGGQFPTALTAGQAVSLMQGARVVDTAGGGGGGDTTPPTVPTGLTATNVGQTSVQLTWSPSSDNVGVTGYDVLRNGTVVGTVAAPGFTDNGLSPATAYSYSVRARDAAGNTSSPSSSLTVVTQAAGGGGFSETFTGANGSPWGASWTTNVSSGSATIQSNAGRLTYNDSSRAFARAVPSGVAPQADSDTTFSYQWSANGSSSYFNVWTRGSGGWRNSYRPQNGYGVELIGNSTSVKVMRNVGGTRTTLATVSNATVATTAKRWLRIRNVGSTFQFKTWADGVTEPAAWNYTTTDSAVSAPGQLFVSLNRGSSNAGAKSVTIDDLTVVSG